MPNDPMPREAAEAGAQAWRSEHEITDREFAEISVLLCDKQPRDLALMVIRLQGQLEVSRTLRRVTTPSQCLHCEAPLPGPCRHPDPCPAWEDFKEEHPEYQEQTP